MWSLRRSLVLIFVALVTAPLALFWAWPHSTSLKNDLAEARQRHLLLARNLGVTLAAYHRDVAAAFSYVSDALLEGDPMPDPRVILSGLKVRHVCLVAPADGTVLAGYSGSSRCPRSFAPAAVAQLMAIAKGGGIHFARPHRNSEGQSIISVVRSGGRGLVVGEIDTEIFAELGRSIAFGERGHAIIIDHAGGLLAHPVRSLERAHDNIAAIPIVQRMLIGETGVDTYYSPVLRETMLAGFTSVPGPGWGVMVAQPIGELMASAARSRSSAVSVFAFGLLAAALIGCRAAMFLVWPVQRVIDAARAMSEGDPNVRVDIRQRFIPKELLTLMRGFNAMAERVSEARSAEAEARQAAEKASRSKTEFLNTVTHELRTPLNAIIGFSDILASGRHGPLGDERYREAAEDVRSASRHLLALTNDLLDLARMEAGQFALSETVFDLDEVTSRAVRFVEIEAHRRGTRIDACHPDGPLTVTGDERILFQSTLNLVVNAVRYGREGGTIIVSTSRSKDGGSRIEIRDDGPGIAPEDLERVLRPFERTKSSESLKSPGSGLGLPIVSRLAALHGGRLELASAVGVGTTATIHLPASRSVALPEPDTLKSAA